MDADFSIAGIGQQRTFAGAYKCPRQGVKDRKMYSIGMALILAGLAQVFAGFIFCRQPGVPMMFFGPIWRANQYLTSPGVALWVGGQAIGMVGLVFWIAARAA